MKNIAKILTALAALAGVVYIVATYGEQIVAWAKKLLNAMPKCPETEVVVDVEAEPVAADAVEEPAAEEIPVEEAVEEPAPEVVVAEHEPVAEENDFAE